MKLLFVASECAPFVKTGGLADVIGAVPKALGPMGGDVRVLLPAYPALAAQVAAGTVVLSLPDLFGGPADVVAVTAEGINLLLIVAPHLYDRPGNIYLDANGQDWSDNHLRFGGLSLVAAKIAQGALGDWQPDLVNAHDWQAGLVSAYLQQGPQPVPPVVLTIHNIAFQGLFDPSVMQALGLSGDIYHPDGAEYFGRFGFLKAGIAMAAKITTVSPTYARELLSPEFGMGLEGLLTARQGDLVGILNGIDTEVWNPETDPALPANYTAKTLKKKADNKAEVERRFDLTSGDGPIFCVVSRLTTQKGLDLLLECLPGLVARGGRLALLGSGDKGLEQAYIAAAGRYMGQVGVIIGYDEPLSHLMQGGSDAILIPSRFEPCGLTQLYGLRYGTLPVVARTGGLADTVIDANDAALVAGVSTGVQFAPISASGLNMAIARTCDLFADTKVWDKITQRAMAHPVDWGQSATAYFNLYQSLIPKGG